MSVEVGIIVALVGLVSTVVVTLWRVGSVGKQVGEIVAKFEGTIAIHHDRISVLEADKANREARELEQLRAQVAKLTAEKEAAAAAAQGAQG